VVVALHPGVDGSLRGLDAGERPGSVEQFAGRSVLCQRSIFPVVVGERGLVKPVVMPFSRQIRSKRTSAGYGLVNLPVNCFPLSVNTSDGTP
jgi:hypothetical protein